MRLLLRWQTLLLFGLQSIVLFIVAPLQVDPHHDGIILGAAIASSEGGIPNKDAFTQYGPLTPMLQGLFLRITNPTMLSLRYFTVIVCLLISVTLFRVIYKISTYRIALTISTFWVATSAVWSTSFPAGLLPWPSLISTLFLLLALLILVEEKEHGRIASTREKNFRYFMAGSLIALAGFARGQSWLMLALVVIGLLPKFLIQWKKILSFFLGFSISWAIFIFFLKVTNALDEFVLQVWIWPLTLYPHVGQGNNYNRFQMVMYFIEFLIFICSIWTCFQITKRLKNTLAKIFVYSVPAFMVAYVGQSIATNMGIPTIPRLVIGEPLERILLSPSYFGCITAVLLFFSFANSRLRDKLKLNSSLWLLASFGLTGVVQLYPQSDVLHLWWISPLVLPLIPYLSHLLPVNQFEKFLKEIPNFVSGLSIAGLIFAIIYIMSPWVQYSLPVLKGTFADPRKAEAISFFDEIATKSIYRNSSFDCPDGIYAVSNGRYNAVDEWFVNWGNVSNDVTNTGQIRFICNNTRVYAENEAKRLGMNLVEYNQSTEFDESLAILEKKSKGTQ